MGSTDAYTCSHDPAITEYNTKAVYIFRANTANTGPATINFNGVGAVPITKVQGAITTPLVDNDIRAGQLVMVAYDGTQMQMISQLGTVPVSGVADPGSNGLVNRTGPTSSTAVTGATVGQALRITGTDAFGFGPLDLADPDAVTNDLPLSNVTPATAASRLLGRGSASAGDWQELTLGTNLALSGTTLNATGGAGVGPPVQLSAATGTVSALACSTTELYYRHDISGPLTLPAFTGTCTDGQKVVFRVKPTSTPQTLSFATGVSKAFSAEQGLPLPTLTGDSATYVDYAFEYNSTSDRFAYIGGTQATAPLARSAGGTGDTYLPRGVVFEIGAPDAPATLPVASTTTAYVSVPFACTLRAYTLLIDAGTVTVKFWKVATGTALPTSANSINTNGVGIASGTALRSTTMTDFTTTAVAANDILAMNVTAASTAKYVSATLQCDQT